MYRGAIIVESLRVGATLENVPLTVGKLSRYRAAGTTSDQPAVWTVIEFEVADADADKLAEALSDVLAAPGWYADFHNDREVFVVFPERVFRYPRGDPASRAAAQEHGRSLGIPEPQLDWTD